MMKTLKNISIFFLLIVLTFGVVFIPQIISGQREENIINEVIHLDYSVGNRPKLTSEQVARIYYNREVSVGYNSLVPVNDQSYASQVDIAELIELIFGKDETICTPIKEIVTSNTMPYFSRNSSLIKVDNHPTALNFVEYENKASHIKYEEKTKAVINIWCDSIVLEFENVKESNLYLEKVTSMISDYYENQLNMHEGQYYCIVEIPIITEKAPNLYIASIHIGCGLLQKDDNKFYIEDDTENSYK